MERDLTLKGKIFSAVENPNSFVIETARKFVRNNVPDHTEISAIILPYATKIEFAKNSGSWGIFTFEDKNEKPKIQKMLVMCINEGKTFEMDIPGQGIFVVSYDGRKVDFQPKKKFDEKKFEEISKTNIAENNRVRDEAIIAANKKRDEERRAELKVKQSASVKPFAIDLDSEVLEQKSAPITIKKGKEHFKSYEETDDTHRPFEEALGKGKAEPAVAVNA